MKGEFHSLNGGFLEITLAVPVKGGFMHLYNGGFLV